MQGFALCDIAEGSLVKQNKLLDDSIEYSQRQNLDGGAPRLK